MRQVFLEKGALAIQDVAEPVLDQHSILVSVHYSFISSGTEAASIANATKAALFDNVPSKIKQVLKSVAVNGIEGTRALVKGRLKGTVQALGYSCSGRVIAVGKKVTQFRTGDFVACAGAGLANHADVVCVPEKLVAPIGDQKWVKAASITTIGSIALQGIRRAQLQFGEIVCVMGLGLLGHISVQLTKAMGCKIIGIDVLSDRLDTAKKAGADRTFLANDPSLEKDVAFFTEHKGVDCVLITAGTPSSDVVQQAMKLTRKKGRVVVVGDVGLNLQRSPLYSKEIDFLISCSYGPGRYDASYEQLGIDYPYAYVRWTENRNMRAVIDFIKKESIHFEQMGLQEFHLDEVKKAYEAIRTEKCLGAILRYLPKNDLTFVPATKHEKKEDQIFFPAIQGDMRVGVIGVGGFAKVKLLPIISKFKGVRIKSFADINLPNAENMSRTYGADHSYARHEELLEKASVNTVVIASPHKFHADQALSALCLGKAVFMEKPMVVDFKQLDAMRIFFKKHPQAPFCVDYNRSFAPFIQKIKWEVVDRTAPLVVHYRMNAGYIPTDHWVQTDVGAGRIIGEACHIFDLFCFLTDSKPAAVSVESLKPTRDDLFPTDNFTAQINFHDGSICSLLYTALGHKDLGKERMEVYFDGKSIVMDDYLSLRGFGTSHAFDETVVIPDKGHKNLLRLFFDGLRTTDTHMPISKERLDTVAELTLIIDQLACRGGGSKEFSS